MQIPYYSGLEKKEQRKVVAVLTYLAGIVGIAALAFLQMPEWSHALLGMLLHIYASVWVFSGILVFVVSLITAWLLRDPEADDFKNIDAFVELGKVRLDSIGFQVVIILLVYYSGFYFLGGAMIVGSLITLWGQGITRGALKARMLRKLTTE